MATKQVNGKAQIRPLAAPKPLGKRDYVTAMQNVVLIGLWVSAPQIRDFAVSFDVASFFGFFWVYQ